MSEGTPSEKQLPWPGTTNGATTTQWARLQRKTSAASSDQSSSQTVSTLGAPPGGVFLRKGSRMIDPISLAAFTKRKLSHVRKSSFFLSNLSPSVKTDPVNNVYGSVNVQNTYCTEPRPNEKFVSSQVHTIIQSILESYLTEEVYEPRKCAHLAQNLTDVIKSRVKEMNLPRYKIVCSVVIGQKQRQAVRCASRCLWNCNMDNFASASFENATLFATATVYGLYYD